MKKYLVKVTFPWGIYFYGLHGDCAGCSMPTPKQILGSHNRQPLTEEKINRLGYKSYENAEKGFRVTCNKGEMPVEIVEFDC